MGVPVLSVLPGLHFGAVGDLIMTPAEKKIAGVLLAEQRRRWARQSKGLRTADPKHGEGGADPFSALRRVVIESKKAEA